MTASSRSRARSRRGWRSPPDVSEADLEARRWPTPTSSRAMDGATVRKVIVRAPKLVNVVV